MLRLIFLKFLLVLILIIPSISAAYRIDPAKINSHHFLSIGRNPQGKEVFLCQAPFNGGVFPGILNKEGGYCQVPFRHKVYDVLVYKLFPRNFANFGWIPQRNGSIPQNAFIGGNSSTGNLLYICRAYYGNKLLAGKIGYPAAGCLLPHDSKVVMVKDYEVMAVY